MKKGNLNLAKNLLTITTWLIWIYLGWTETSKAHLDILGFAELFPSIWANWTIFVHVSIPPTIVGL